MMKLAVSCVVLVAGVDGQNRIAQLITNGAATGVAGAQNAVGDPTQSLGPFGNMGSALNPEQVGTAASVFSNLAGPGMPLYASEQFVNSTVDGGNTFVPANTTQYTGNLVEMVTQNAAGAKMVSSPAFNVVQKNGAGTLLSPFVGTYLANSPVDKSKGLIYSVGPSALLGQNSTRLGLLDSAVAVGGNNVSGIAKGFSMSAPGPELVLGQHGLLRSGMLSSSEMNSTYNGTNDMTGSHTMGMFDFKTLTADLFNGTGNISSPDFAAHDTARLGTVDLKNLNYNMAEYSLEQYNSTKGPSTIFLDVVDLDAAKKAYTLFNSTNVDPQGNVQESGLGVTDGQLNYAVPDTVAIPNVDAGSLINHFMYINNLEAASPALFGQTVAGGYVQPTDASSTGSA